MVSASMPRGGIWVSSGDITPFRSGFNLVFLLIWVLYKNRKISDMFKVATSLSANVESFLPSQGYVKRRCQIKSLVVAKPCAHYEVGIDVGLLSLCISDLYPYTESVAIIHEVCGDRVQSGLKCVSLCQWDGWDDFV